MTVYSWVRRQIRNIIALANPKSAQEYILQSVKFDSLAAREDHLREYDAAKSTGPNKAWRPTNTSADQEIRAGGATIRARARSLERNNSYVKGMVRRFIINTVGEGCYPRPMVYLPDKSGLDKAACNAIYSAHEEWAEEAGITGESLYDLQKQVAWHCFVDGEVFLLKVFENKTLKYQLLEADQLDITYDLQLPNGNNCVQGVELNRFGKPVAYYFYDSDPREGGMFASKSSRIPADRVLHIFDKDRSSQHRGVAHFASVVMDLFDISEFKDAVMLVQRVAASFGVFVETPYPEDFIYNEQTTQAINTTIGANREEWINPTAIQYLRVGEKPHSLSPNQPTSVYKDFVNTHLRGAAVGVGDSFEEFSGNYEGSSYSSARQAKIIAKAVCRFYNSIFDRKLNIPIYRAWMDFAVAAGKLEAPGYDLEPRRWQAVRHSKPRQDWIDPLKEAQAAEIELRLGLRNRTEIIEDRGGDRDETLNVLAEEQDILFDLGMIPNKYLFQAAGPDAKTDPDAEPKTEKEKE